MDKTIMNHLCPSLHAVAISALCLLGIPVGLNAAPAALGIRTEPALDNEGRLTGEIGTVAIKLIIDFNKEVNINTVSSEDFEIVGESGDATGKTLPHLLWNYDASQEDKLTVELSMGPLDSGANGEYSIRVKEGAISGTGENPTTIPGGEIGKFTQDITDPLPAVLLGENWDGIHDLEYHDGHSFQIYYNTAVDPDSLDGSDVIVTGISEGNLGVVLPIGESVVSLTYNDPFNGSFVSAQYYLATQTEEALNGDFKVEIVEGQVLDKKNPPNAVPAGLVDTFNQYVIDPFRVFVNGRVFLDTGEPSLVDEGSDVDPGLEMSTLVDIFNGPALRSGYHDVWLGNSVRSSDPTGLLALPMATVVAEEAMSGSFSFSGYQAANALQIGDTFMVVGSTGNDGQYTVRTSEFIENGDVVTSIIGVEEAVVSGVADGTITRDYSTNIIINGTLFPISVTGLEVPTYESLLSLLNTQIGDAGSVSLTDLFRRIRVKSATLGDSSTVLIDEPFERTSLLTNLALFSGFDTPVLGGDEFTEGYQDVGLWINTTIADPTNLIALPVTTVVASSGVTTGSFTVSGDQTSNLQVGDTFSVVGSTGNDGTYTVATSENFFGTSTTVGVSEAVPSAVADGTITKVYTADVTIDGIPRPVSIIGTEAETFENLLDQINSQLEGAGTVLFKDVHTLRVQSASAGDTSTVLINEPDPRRGLFSTLSVGYPPFPPVPGTDRYIEGYTLVHFNRTVYNELPTGLASYPISMAVAGSAGSFSFSGNQQPIDDFYPETLPLQVGDIFTVLGSTANDGTYTIKTVAFDPELGSTKIEVEEPVAGSVADGVITKIYTANIIIDGQTVPVSIIGRDAPTVADLVTQLNLDLGNSGKASLYDFPNDLKITSATDGITSHVFIQDPGGRTGLFSNLGNASFGGFGSSVRGSDGWEHFTFTTGVEWFEEKDQGKFETIFTQPGNYRIRTFSGITYINGGPAFEVLPPLPEWVIQAVGDPSREGAPKDHSMYLTVSEEMKGQSLTVNFSYVEENESPHPAEDDFQVLVNSQAARLNVLRNDVGQDLRIIGLTPWFGPDVISTNTESQGSQANGSVITTDGDYVYYTPAPGFRGYEAFYYTIEDSQGNRDFELAWLAVSLTITNQFAANDDFASIPVNAKGNRINVLANDTVAGGGSKDQLVITNISTPTAGGEVSFQGSDVIYLPPPDFMGKDSFTYTMTDGYSGTDTATVEVSVTNSPISSQQAALLNVFMRLFGSSQRGNAIFALFRNHINEINYIIVDQGEGTVAPKANGKLPLSRLQVGGTAESQAQLNALLDLAEPAFVSVVTGNGDSGTVSQELVDMLMNQINYIAERASPDLKADLQALCEMTNDFQDLVGKTFNESAAILGLEPDKISIPNLAIERISNALSITTYDVVGVAYKLWKSRNLQSDSWEEVQNAEVETTGQRIKISDPDIGDEDAFYQLTTEVD